MELLTMLELFLMELEEQLDEMPEPPSAALFMEGVES